MIEINTWKIFEFCKNGKAKLKARSEALRMRILVTAFYRLRMI